MAFGFPPAYSENISLENMSPRQFLVLAAGIAKQLQWNVSHISEKGLIAFVKSGLFNRVSKITVMIGDEWVILKSQSTGSELADLGKNRKVIDSFTTIFYGRRYSFDPTELDKEYEALQPNLVQSDKDILAAGHQKAGGFLSLFVPRKRYFVTPILVDLNLLIFIMMVISGVSFFSPDGVSLVNWGANFRPITLDGQWWRLVTNFFVHVGILHVLFNMYALIYIGLLLEPYLGSTRFAITYFLTGIIASTTSLYWHDTTISAGASGAIFGMYGVFLVMLVTGLIEKSSRKALLSSIAIFVGYNLLNGMKGGIDNAAHIGGLTSGILIGFSFYPVLKKPGPARLNYSITGLLILAVIITSSYVCHIIPNSYKEFDEKMNLFSSTEQSAMKIYHMPHNSSKDLMLSAVKDSGIDNWNRNIQLLREVVKMKIPAAYKERAYQLINYCNLRIDCYNFIYKAIDENTGMYNDSIKYYSQQIQMEMDRLKTKNSTGDQ